ncbi:MAG TPA: efflux RND transporter permease subunit [Caldithrix abyssi]|uniref:Efflux RND transporter permease subunit n=1 Tax=Caldithrix abyssi TaxID=187145 RepID=A0A7V1LND4_CALAY|nr:efflux RND transporter permease subunit [Caldithrix abyssi]
MKLPRLAIDNHQFTLVMVVLLTLAGLASFITMPRSEDPQVAPPATSIIVIYPGASPADIEQLIVDPIEEAINELDDIKKFHSESNDGMALITVEFTGDSDAGEKYNDVVQKVGQVRNTLPGDVMSIELIKWAISNTNILQVALSSDSTSYARLKKNAERLKKKLEQIPGVRRAKIWAVPDQQVRISLDIPKMAALKIPLKLVTGALQSANVNIPAGSMDIGDRKFNIRTSGRFTSLEEIRNTIIHARAGRPLRLSDIAHVEFIDEDQTYKARFNGRRSIFLTMNQKEGTNIFNVIDAARAEIESFKAELGTDSDLFYVFDQSKSVAKRLNVFFSNLAQGMLLVGFIIFLAFGFNLSLLITLVIPLSIVIAIAFVDLSGYGLQQMSIVAMVIALGLLVDNAIVVTENIIRFQKMGYARVEAAIKGVGQVGWAVVSSTVTTVLAFVPIIMMQDMTGKFIRSMPVTVVYILLASLLLALTLTPYLASRFLKEKPETKPRWLLRLFNGFITKTYRQRLRYVLANPKKILALTIAVFIFSLALFPLVGVSFFPKAEKNQFIININTPMGSTLDYTDGIARRVEDMLDRAPQIAGYASNIGRGNPQIYYNVQPKNESSNHAQLFVQLSTEDKGIIAAYLDSLRRETARIPGARIDVKEFQQGPPVEAPIAIKILGDDLDELTRIARHVEKMMRETTGMINIENPLATSATDLYVSINREKAALSGIPLHEIDQTIRAALTGQEIGSYRDNQGEDYPLTLRLPRPDKMHIRDFAKIYLNTPQGEAVPLAQLAEITFKETPAVITHFKTQRNVTLKADAADGYSVNSLTAGLIEQLDNYDWPGGYGYYVGGELESRQESFGGMGKAALVALIAIFGVLVLQFRSYRQPLIVFSAIPLAITGSILALLVSGYSFSFTAFIGLTSLIGIVINNSIILVDYTNQLRAEGANINEALIKAGETRFTPIILTTATTIGGLLPLTLGGGTLWAPMGWTIIGGLTLSTVLTLLIVPTLYTVFSKESEISAETRKV